MEEKIKFYNKFAKLSREKLDKILADIQNFEDQYEQDAQYLEILKAQYNQYERKYGSLIAENKQQNTPQQRKDEIKNEIAVMDGEITSIISDTDKLEKELSQHADQKEKYANIKDVIKNYILRDKPLVEVQEKRTEDVATSSKDVLQEMIPPAGTDESNRYLTDIYNMYLNHQSEDTMYKTMQSYSTAGLEKIRSDNKKYMREYEQHLDEKARMDMRVGRKTKNYSRLVGIVQKYKNEYSFKKRTPPLIEKILKERQQIDIGVDPIKDFEKGTIDIEKLKKLIQTHPNFKDIIGKTALSEMVRTGVADKQSLDAMKDFFKPENLQSRITIQANQRMPEYTPKKPVTLEDYGELIPPRMSIIRS